MEAPTSQTLTPISYEVSAATSILSCDLIGEAPTSSISSITYFFGTCSPRRMKKKSATSTPFIVAEIGISIPHGELNTTAGKVPPPPVFSLDDRPDFTPEPESLQLALPSSSTPPSQVSLLMFASPSPLKARAAKGGSESGGSDLIQPGALIMIPPPREVARPEGPHNGVITGGGLNKEEWMTVYGFTPADTNLVLQEFEKYGVILKYVPGPKDANSMHIVYQNWFNAQKALRKDADK